MNTEAEKQNFVETLPGGLSFEMVYVEGGEFLMGGSDPAAYKDEKPIHEVNLPSFYLGKYPVTQSLWQAVMGDHPSNFKGEDRPVERVSWHDAQNFLKKLKERTGNTYRLPREAEWEYAARGGIRSEGFLYAGSDKLKEVGWYEENSGYKPHPVGEHLGNELGLYDMSGNVWEWCEDDWHDGYAGAPSDGSAWIDQPIRGAIRVLRGGSWIDRAKHCCVSSRNRLEPDVRHDDAGFRLCLSSPG